MVRRRQQVLNEAARRRRRLRLPATCAYVTRLSYLLLSRIRQEAVSKQAGCFSPKVDARHEPHEHTPSSHSTK